MKTFIYILTISLSLLSCGGGDDNPPIPEPINNSPSKPSAVAPSNNLLCIDNNVTFEWTECTDPDGDAISYQLEIATDNQFTQNVQTRSNITALSVLLTLEKGVAYYWRVKAVDSKNMAGEPSNTFQFYTEGNGVSNHLPFSPSVITPKLYASVSSASATLEWSASDVDNDPLTFDIYFGTDNPPVNIVSENQTANTFDVDLSASTNYFWKVVAKDDKGGITNGQVWNFKTE